MQCVPPSERPQRIGALLQCVPPDFSAPAAPTGGKATGGGEGGEGGGGGGSWIYLFKIFHSPTLTLFQALYMYFHALLPRWNRPSHTW